MLGIVERGAGKAKKPDVPTAGVAGKAIEGAEGAIKDLPKISAYDLKLTQTVENHLKDVDKSGHLVRPYGDSRAIMQYIIDSSKPTPDPRGVPGALRWEAHGNLNGKTGKYELVIDPKTNTVLHFLWKGDK